MKKRSIKLSCLLTSLSLLFSFTAFADTSADLVALYEQNIYVPSQEDRQELQMQIAEYNKLVEADRRIKEYNTATDIANEQIDIVQRQVEAQVSQLMSNSSEYSNFITMNIYGDIDTLIEKDAAYKSTIETTNVLLAELNKYNAAPKMKELDVDLQAEYERIKDMQEQMELPKVQHVEGEFELGDVYYCKSPVDTKYGIESQWGSRVSPLTQSTIQYHNGVDLKAETGTDVKALFNGTVLESGENWALGNYVRIQHGPGIITLYAHLDSYSVKAGDTVTQQQVIAKSGATGNRVSGPCLHLGMFINGQSVDPAIVLKNAE